MEEVRAMSGSVATAVSLREGGQYVPVCSHHNERWMAVLSMVQSRRAAAQISGASYRGRLDDRGRAPTPAFTKELTEPTRAAHVRDGATQ
jgi:hypothetical protein